MPGHDFVKLLLDHVEPRRDSLGALGSQGVDRAVEVIEGIEQVFRQRSDRVDPIGVRLLLGPLLVIGELGPCPQGLIAELVTLLFQ